MGRASARRCRSPKLSLPLADCSLTGRNWRADGDLVGVHATCGSNPHARNPGMFASSPGRHAVPCHQRANKPTCVRRMSATRNMNLRMPSRRAMMEESEIKMERERCLGWEMRLQGCTQGGEQRGRCNVTSCRLLHKARRCCSPITRPCACCTLPHCLTGLACIARAPCRLRTGTRRQRSQLAAPRCYGTHANTMPITIDSSSSAVMICTASTQAAAQQA